MLADEPGVAQRGQVDGLHGLEFALDHEPDVAGGRPRSEVANAGQDADLLGRFVMAADVEVDDADIFGAGPDADDLERPALDNRLARVREPPVGEEHVLRLGDLDLAPDFADRGRVGLGESHGLGEASRRHGLPDRINGLAEHALVVGEGGEDAGAVGE